MSAKAVTLTVKGASKENDSFARHPFYDSVKTIEIFNMSFFFGNSNSYLETTVSR